MTLQENEADDVIKRLKRKLKVVGTGPSRVCADDLIVSPVDVDMRLIDLTCALTGALDMRSPSAMLIADLHHKKLD